MGDRGVKLHQVNPLCAQQEKWFESALGAGAHLDYSRLFQNTGRRNPTAASHAVRTTDCHVADKTQLRKRDGKQRLSSYMHTLG